MKFRNLIIGSLLIVGVFSTHYSFAQNNTPSSAKTYCNDNEDNDGDGKIDFNGGIKTDGTKVPKDPECLTAQTPSESPLSSSTPINKDLMISIKINNPLKVDTISGAINLFMSAVLRIAIPFIVIFFIWSGVSFVLARGNPTKIETAKNMFWYTIIGTLLILGAWVITNAIIGTVNSITG